MWIHLLSAWSGLILNFPHGSLRPASHVNLLDEYVAGFDSGAAIVQAISHKPDFYRAAEKSAGFLKEFTGIHP
jgi:prephenate dehydrogenase